MPLKASLGYARARRTHADAADALRKAGYDWCGNRFPGEQSDPAALRAWGRVDPLPGSAGPPARVRSSRVRRAGSGRWPCGSGARCCSGAGGAGDGAPSTSPGRCRPARRCSRRAPAPARRSPSPRWSTRFVAEGRATLDQLLVITFGRAASQELRERVREQLVAAERALAEPDAADRSHPVVAHLLTGEPTRVAERHRRLRDALASFDSATIATTHQFCQTVLRSLGVAGDTDTGATLVESLDELVVEVVDDVYLRRFGHDATHTAVHPGRGARPGVDGRRRRPRATGRGRRPPRARAGSGSGSPTRCAPRSSGASGGSGSSPTTTSSAGSPTRSIDADAPARERMRQRWKVVLVDEFQDTDPKQWEVLDRAFTGHATVVLIGDPKQAIYAFRGGDVVTYLAAAATATTQATLDTNRRSDADLVERLQVVLRGAALGDPRIVVRDVTADHAGSRLAGAPHPAPFRIRQVRRDGFALAKGKVRATTPAATSPPTVPPTSPRCSPPTPPGTATRSRPDTSPCWSASGRRPSWSGGRLAERGRPGGGGRRHQAAHLAGRRRVAVPARGARAAPPVRPGAGGRAHVVPRAHPRRARRRR